jgi:hypothetical protein
MSIIFDYDSLNGGISETEDAACASSGESRDYVVYCYCRGRDLYNTSCACFGTAKFYGPERSDLNRWPVPSRILASTGRPLSYSPATLLGSSA